MTDLHPSWSAVPAPNALQNPSSASWQPQPRYRKRNWASTLAVVLLSVAISLAVLVGVFTVLCLAFYLVWAAPGYVYQAVLRHTVPVGMILAGVPALAGIVFGVIGFVKGLREDTAEAPGRTVTLGLLAGALGVFYIIGASLTR